MSELPGPCTGCGAPAVGLFREALPACAGCADRVQRLVGDRWVPNNYLLSLLRPDAPGTGSMALSPKRRAAREAATAMANHWLEIADTLDRPEVESEQLGKLQERVMGAWATEYGFADAEQMRQALLVQLARMAGGEIAAGRPEMTDTFAKQVAFLFPEVPQESWAAFLGDFRAAAEQWAAGREKPTNPSWAATAELLRGDSTREVSPNSVKRAFERHANGAFGEVFARPGR